MNMKSSKFPVRKCDNQHFTTRKLVATQSLQLTQPPATTRIIYYCPGKDPTSTLKNTYGLTYLSKRVSS